MTNKGLATAKATALVGVWGAVGVLFGFAAGVEWGVVIFFLLVGDLWCDEGLFDSLLCCGFGVGLGVADSQRCLVLGYGFFAIVFDVVKAA